MSRVTITLTLSDTVKLLSQTKLGGELLPERRVRVSVTVRVSLVIQAPKLHDRLVTVFFGHSQVTNTLPSA